MGYVIRNLINGSITLLGIAIFVWALAWDGFGKLFVAILQALN